MLYLYQLSLKTFGSQCGWEVKMSGLFVLAYLSALLLIVESGVMGFGHFLQSHYAYLALGAGGPKWL